MNIVIIGLGNIGKNVLRSLVAENHTVTAIDTAKSKIEEIVEKYDIMGVIGNGACFDIQREAGVSNAELVIAMTGNDELNIFACLVANRLGAKSTVARVRNPDYRRQIAEMKQDLGISMIINPERETAREIFNLIDLPSATRVEHFANGKALLVEASIQKGCFMIGESLNNLGKRLSSKVLICAVQRGDEVFIPSGDFVIEENDTVHFTSDVRCLGDFLKETRLFKTPLKNVMIVGGGRTGFYLADELSKKKYRVKLIEKEEEKAQALAETLPKVSVCYGNGTNHEFLLEEGIEATDAFVALTDIDEENIVVSMFAEKKNVKKTVSKVKSDELIDMNKELGLKNVVSPKYIVAERIVGYARALDNSRGSNIVSLYRLVNEKVEALEFFAKTQSAIFNKPLKNLKIKKGCLIACIIRKNEVIIPSGDTEIKLGDNVVVVTSHKNYDDLTDAFE